MKIKVKIRNQRSIGIGIGKRWVRIHVNLRIREVNGTRSAGTNHASGAY